MTSIDDYDFDLPRELIAQEPLSNRSDARLMIVDRERQDISHMHVRDLPEVLRRSDLLVLNNSRVLPARLVGFRTSTGGRWEGLFLAADEQGMWRLLGKTRGKLVEGETVTLVDGLARPVVELRMVLKLGAGEWAARPETQSSTLEILEQVGRVPLPHYIRQGEMMPSDRQRYQTVFATIPGSVAAPTAGLHFTDQLLGRLRQQGIQSTFITLHVGIGTFRPIAVERVEEHQMHSEFYAVSGDTVNDIKSARNRGGRVIAVGTTSLRTLESVARHGPLQPMSGTTQLYVHPPFDFRAVDALLTNFHLPKSSLLVLVRTFGGDALLRRAYAEAIQERYRFFSYGDAMLIL